MQRILGVSLWRYLRGSYHKGLVASGKVRFFNYNTALTRDIDNSLLSAALIMSVSSRVALDIDRARKQHAHLNSVLASLGVELHNLSSGGHPDSVFIEDTMVAIDRTVVLTNPGALSRRAEIGAVREYISKHEPFKSQVEVVELESGTLDGGDVLFTGTFC